VRPTLVARAQARAADLGSLLRFLVRRRSIWLAILVLLLLLATAWLYVAQTASVAPYVYPLF
jgi:hypothetical protein